MIGFSKLSRAFAMLAAVVFMMVSTSSGVAHAQSGAEPAATAANAQAMDYLLGPGDKVRVTVYGEESLSGEFFVSGSGLMSLPLIGEIKVGGMTVGQFQTAVQDKLKDGYLKDPRVSAEVLTFRPFYILGEVEKPGTYPYTSGLTVLNAVATAGGFTYRADKKSVYIKRNGDTSENKGELKPSTLVSPGDTIRIGERFF
ncbi:polysaccharide export outer membrane protein [Caulobacter sp. BE264]|jgi:protein involved in polysaccharide export with SLBB domain|uniref:polysaccharide biosynthesis/export family protein n=1 Tax=Caulobacter sp. BE264 TaxID=2817724 RepID=UPI002864D7CF|nr:polysaccharide biosynthesis/export family protein [Caulobacter sp. BE264]MDR7230975.1 polysaccharide export outer membrane protein [Caulobacter sp. BE264]